MRTGTAQIFTHFHAMKKVHKSLLWAIVGLFALSFSSTVKAQDDLYYDPATDAPAPTAATYTEEYTEKSNVTRTYNDNDQYYEDDDYAYEYSSRIRRFQNRSVAADYYDPLFVDLNNYDPFYSPGTSIYVYNYNDYWSYRRWQRWNRWNSWNSGGGWGGGGWGGGGWGGGGGWNSWGWNSAYSFNSPWYNPWVVNNFYYDPYWTCNGYNPYFQNQFYGNGWANNHYYYNNNNGNGGNGDNGGGYSPQTYTGPRRNGSSVNPGYARIPDSKGRLATAEPNVPMIEKTSARPSRTAGDIEGNTDVGRGKTATDRTATPSIGGRRPEGSARAPGTRTPETPTGRGIETPSTRNDEGYKPRRPNDAKSPRTEKPSTRSNEGYKPRRSQETPARPQTETRTRRNNNDGGATTPRRSEPSPTRTEESRPARRTEERSSDRPSRSNNNGGGQESRSSRSSRSSEGGSSTRSSGGGGGSSRKSSDSGSGKSSGRGGRN